MVAALKSILGPRVPDPVLAANRPRFILPTALLVGATVLLLASFFQPYWHVTVFAPGHDQELELRVHLNHLDGDVEAIDGVHRSLGIPSLVDAAPLERTLSPMTIIVLGLLVIAAITIHSPWAAVASLPALLFPVGFLVDVHFWLRSFGPRVGSLDADAQPFKLFGETTIGDFRSVAGVGSGLMLAILASLVILVGLYFHRRAYKPMVDARRSAEQRWGSSDAPSG